MNILNSSSSTGRKIEQRYNIHANEKHDMYIRNFLLLTSRNRVRHPPPLTVLPVSADLLLIDK
jgi:hypothetical protein